MSITTGKGSDLRSGLFVLLPAAGMEICRLYVAVSLLYRMPESPPCPFAALACILLVGTLVGRGLSFITRRRITTAIVNIVLCGLGIFIVAWPYSGFPFWFSASIAVLFWFRGVFIGSREICHATTVTRYDIGIGIFFFIYFLFMAMGEADPYAMRIVGAYFLFSILAMAASRSWERDENYISSRPAWSLIVPFISVFFLIAAAFVLLYPMLTTAATGVYVFLQEASRPLLHILLAIIRFLFGFGRVRPDSSPAVPKTPEINLAPVEELAESGILEKILAIIFILIAVALGIVLIVIITRALVRYLAEKKYAGPGLFAGLKILFRFLLNSLIAALYALGRNAALFARRRPLAGAGQEAFRRLCAWGRLSGVPRKKSETPGEYVRRLAIRFPSLEEALCLFARVAEEELYGRKIPAAEDMAQLKEASMRLSNPALVPRRIAGRLGFYYFK